jgi:hypothetical protein
MADFRCPKHDVIFQAETDQRRPGSERMPADCHPDCPQGKREAKEGTGSAAGTSRVIG